ncbi:hypothetical protein RO3G_16053 [Rhizopus delemar RA 99-880]|uniref:Uncharacterized protein n=1 Tax=Rhizopus delemar (strain RA 99-880 / ATCC MYA-4621 / FGSC 9543 / NRRL 43880) TaxID=246409 RepID=I1CSB2_RHIO9|nr:hypothetical protein RO3G_16053 [Rhizopus delemar RA 99-880]|eukprot:EIE91342.1 hypothetical protein RO3G_16053 [Rhizopus delemar RA 99-880]
MFKYKYNLCPSFQGFLAYPVFHILSNIDIFLRQHFNIIEYTACSARVFQQPTIKSSYSPTDVAQK